jgi:hypothetical protein
MIIAICRRREAKSQAECSYRETSLPYPSWVRFLLFSGSSASSYNYYSPFRIGHPVAVPCLVKDLMGVDILLLRFRKQQPGG